MAFPDVVEDLTDFGPGHDHLKVSARWVPVNGLGQD